MPRVKLMDGYRAQMIVWAAEVSIRTRGPSVMICDIEFFSPVIVSSIIKEGTNMEGSNRIDVGEAHNCTGNCQVSTGSIQRKGRKETASHSSHIWLFGHGNLNSMSQALFEYGQDLPFFQPCNEQSMVHTAVAFSRARHRLSTFACTTLHWSRRHQHDHRGCHRHHQSSPSVALSGRLFREPLSGSGPAAIGAFFPSRCQRQRLFQACQQVL